MLEVEAHELLKSFKVLVSVMLDGSRKTVRKEHTNTTNEKKKRCIEATVTKKEALASFCVVPH